MSRKLEENVEGINRVVKNLDKVHDAILPNSPRRMRALRVFADFGYNEWKDRLDNAEPMDDSEKDTTLETPHLANGNAEIRCHGKDTLFVEFGTGVKHNRATQYGQQFGFYPTSWSGGPQGKGWLVGAKRSIYKGRWILPTNVTPERYRNDRQSIYYKKRYVTKSGEVHEYVYQRRHPAVWAEGHKPVNGMFYALRKLRSDNAFKAFVSTLFMVKKR